MPQAQKYWTDTLLDEKRLIADPEADAVLANLVKEEGLPASRQFFDKLIRQIEMPKEEFPPIVREFLTAHDRLPEYASSEDVEKAHDLFEDHGPKFLLFLYFKSLPQLYSCALGAKVLAHSGRLVHSGDDMSVFSRRIAETGQFLIDVMTKGNLAPGTLGIQSILKVRLIHAAIRQFVEAGQWNEAEWGKPINQEDLAVTMLTFSISITDALEQLGLEEDDTRETAYLRTWTAIGRLLGIDADLLPESLDDARFLLGKILDRQASSSSEGQTLTAALVHFSKQSMPSDRIQNLPEVLIHHLVGEEIAKYLNVLPKSGCMAVWLPAFLKVAFNWVERLEDTNESAHALIDRIAVELTNGMVNYFNEYKGTSFRIPESLQEKWDLGES